MTAKLIDGRALAQKIRHEVAIGVEKRLSMGLSAPGLAVILVGLDPASEIYVRRKQQACEKCKIRSHLYSLSAETQESELLDLINALNLNPEIHGILVQLPLPAHIDPNKIVEQIAVAKDVDGFHPFNLGRLAQRRPALRPCTPYGIMMLLDELQIPYHGLEVVVVGASNIVGRPMSLELLYAGATVTVCHRFTRDLAAHVSRAQLLIVAIGKPHIIQTEWLRRGVICIDVGMNRLADGRLMGDIDFETAKHVASWLTPVPGGVGPMTVATLLKNTLYAANQQNGET